MDDVQDNRTIYVLFLKFSGYRIAEAENGAEALEKATTLLPDVIVMDLSLPVMDGWEATRRLKRDPRTKKIPVVVADRTCPARARAGRARGRLRSRHHEALSARPAHGSHSAYPRCAEGPAEEREVIP